jgi:hypothetical protein
MKSRHVKPTSFRAHRLDLLPSDLRNLEDIGILVDASACPGAADKHEVTWPAGPTQPYHPAYDDLSKPGDARLLMAPIATYQGAAAILDAGWERVRPVVAHSLAEDGVTVIALSDHLDNVEPLRQTLAFCREQGARFSTLSLLAANP